MRAQSPFTRFAFFKRKRVPSASNGDSGFTASAAKWLIPSVSALFLIVGYVVRSAHQSLLGIDLKDIVSENYAGEATDFFGVLPTVLFNFFAAAAESSVSFSIHKWDMYAAVGFLLLVLLLGIRFFKTSQSRARLVGIALFIAVAAKFLLFDAPLTLIEGVAVVTPIGKDAGVEPGWQPPEGGNFAQKLVRGRAQQIWTGMKCQRLGDLWRKNTEHKGSGQGEREQTLGKDCTLGADQSRDEFVMQIVATALIVVLAVLALLASSRTVKVLGLLSLFYCLTLPYAYGKLLKPTNFQYGWVELTSNVAERVKVQLQNATGVQAIVLGDSPAGVSVLYMHEDNCSATADGERTYRVARIWSISRSQVLAVREIYREDLILWKLLHEKGCGLAPAPLPTSNLCKEVPPARWKALGLNCQ